MLYIICASFDNLGQNHAFANPEQSTCLWPEESLLEVDLWRDLCHENTQFQLTDLVFRRFSLCLFSSALLCFCWSDNQGTQHVDVSVVRQACGAVCACPAVTAGYHQSLELEQKHHGQLQHLGRCTFDSVYCWAASRWVKKWLLIRCTHLSVIFSYPFIHANYKGEIVLLGFCTIICVRYYFLTVIRCVQVCRQLWRSCCQGFVLWSAEYNSLCSAEYNSLCSAEYNSLCSAAHTAVIRRFCH